MLKHKGCEGRFQQYTIREHNYCFMRCDRCHHTFGGQKVEDEINRLMAIKVRPTIRRA